MDPRRGRLPQHPLPRGQALAGYPPRQLGEGYEVVDEALNGRTTDLVDPTVPGVTGAGLDGSAYLPAAMASHLPLDLVIIMLGTNDLKAMYDRSPFRIALGVGELVDIVQTIDGGVGTDYPDPKVLVLGPPPLGRLAPRGLPGHVRGRAGEVPASCRCH